LELRGLHVTYAGVKVLEADEALMTGGRYEEVSLEENKVLEYSILNTIIQILFMEPP
jgi:hypothetical protein